ncbi:oxidoreductase [Candidatus Chlorohelix sp.]|uniref:oxidoreductase n=1 Tax=Candidatus Chlorohelix sp. TaxID=3139201 RepID=UPI00302693EB
MSIFKAGIIGYGLSGAVFHAPLISRLKEFELYKIASSNPDKAHKDYPEALVVSSPEELINDPQVDLVVVCTPNTSHFSLTSQALNAGKNVVLEKPFVNRLEEGEELIRLAEKNKRLLSVYQNRRWDGDFLTIKKLIESDVLGEIYTYESHFDRFRLEVGNKWREQALEGSGILFDLGAHLIDQALQLFGKPQTIWADAFPQRPGANTIDYFHLIFGYERLRVILHSGSVNKKPGPRFQVHGSKGSYIKYGLDPQEDALKRGMRPGDSGWGKESSELYGELFTEAGELTLSGKSETLPGSYETFYKGIYATLTDGTPPPVTAQEALEVIKFIHLAEQSSREKRVLIVE